MNTEAIAQSKIFVEAFDHKAPFIACNVDKQARFMKTTEFLSRTHGFETLGRTEGRSMYDIKCDLVHSASELDRQWHKVMMTQTTIDMLDFHRLADGEARLLVVTKFPTYDDTNEVNGAGAICKQIKCGSTHNNLLNLLISGTQRYLDSKKPISITCEQTNRFDTLGLTTKESECLYFLMRGRSAKSIASALNRSPRTIETHLNNMKERLNCTSRSDLIDLAFAYNLLHFIPRSLVNSAKST